MQPLQMGDTNRTCANIARAQQDLNYAPNVSISDGIEVSEEEDGVYYHYYCVITTFILRGGAQCE